MTQGPQQPGDHGQQPGFQGPPPMYPQFQPPNPSSGGRSGKTAVIIVVAVVIALVAVIALAFTLTRTSDGDSAAGPSSAASSSSAGSVGDEFRLHGNLTSKASVCVASGLTSQQIPKFKEPVDYSSPGLDTSIDKAKQDLSRLASRVSPNAEAPAGPTVQDWITSYVDALDSMRNRAPADEVKWKRDLVDNLSGSLNDICKTN